MLWTSANETRKVPPRQEIELATEMRSTETYFHFSRKKSLQSQQAPRHNAALGVACLTWWAPYTRLRRLPGTLTYGTSSTSGTIARGPSPSKSWRPSGGATGTARPCICNTSRSAAEPRLRSPCCGTTRGPTARRRGAGPTRGGCQSPRSLNWRTSEAASMRHGHSISLLCLLLLCLRRGQPCTTSRLRQRLRQRLRRPCCPSE